MKENQNLKKDGKVLYIAGAGEDSNETIVYALEMPVSVVFNINNDGTASIEFLGKATDKSERMVCRASVIPDVAPPVQLKRLKLEKNVEEVAAKIMGGWIATYMTFGVFCINSEKDAFVCSLDMRDLMNIIKKNLESLYNKYREAYQ